MKLILVKRKFHEQRIGHSPDAITTRPQNKVSAQQVRAPKARGDRNVCLKLRPPGPAAFFCGKERKTAKRN